MRWSSHVSRPSTSTWPFSPTSVTTISTTTGRWRTTSRRRRCSSPRATRCAASCRPTTPGDGACCEQARIPTVAVHHADATDVVLRAGSSAFTWRGQRIITPLTGAINVDNALLAAEAALALDEPHLGPEEIARAMAHLAPVPGRLQVIAAPGGREGASAASASAPPRPPPTAHRSRCWSTTRTRRPGWRWCWARRGAWPGGPGALRLRLRREPRPGQAPPDGRGGGAASDLAFLTSDNPRNEDPLAIIEEVLTGIPGGRANPQVVVEPDRGVAIRLALDAARPGDVVVIAGKGHETYQEMVGSASPSTMPSRHAGPSRLASGPGPGARAAPPAGAMPIASLPEG